MVSSNQELFHTWNELVKKEYFDDLKNYDEIIRSRKERDKLHSEVKNLHMLKIKERERYTSYPKVRKSLERLSNAEIYEDDILAIDTILSMTGIGHQYKDKHRYIQTLTND